MNPQSPNLHPEERHDRLLRELGHDPYHAKKKLSEPTVCPHCGAIFHAGRWQWAEPPAAAHRELCPACRRVEDQCPAGFLTLGGEFFAGHKADILNLVHNVEQREKAEHALKRIMSVEEQDGDVMITFTDPQLARAAGEAVQAAYKGELDFAYQENEFLLRVSWHR
jgi:NMD protein affecting ribosome stability and mRNA decay